MEQVIVKRRQKTGVDAGNMPIYELVALPPVNVEAAPGAFNDIDGSNRDGVDVKFTLYGPVGWDVQEQDVVTVRGEDLLVVGKPAAWTEERAVGGTVVEVNTTHG